VVEAGPRRARRDIVDACVDRRVETAEALRDGLDRLVVPARRAVERLGPGQVAGGERGGEALGAAPELGN
jgi:hypothetical protein